MKLVEEHNGYMELQIPAHTLLLSELFETIHNMQVKTNGGMFVLCTESTPSQDEFEIEDFSVSQTTLEHVFVNMIKEQDWGGGN